MRHTFILALMAIAFSGSVSLGAASREQQQMMADIRMLQMQAQQLQAMLGTLNDSLKTVTAKIEEQAGVNRKAFADSKLLIDNMAGDVRVLREKVDDTNVRLGTLSQEVEGVRLSIPPPAPPSYSGDPSMQAPDDPSAPAPVDPAPPPPMGIGMTPTRLYQTAFADYGAGQWSLAISGFETYIKTFPKGDRAGDAQYYIGQSHYNDGKNEEAIAAYEKVVANYPNSNVAPDAYYKMGVVLDRIGQPDRARQAYEQAVKNWPDSEAGRLAKQRIDQVNRPKP